MEKITLTSKTRQCVSQNSFLGYEGENQANKLVFEFTDGFKDGLGQLNLKREDTLGYVSLDKVGETYEFPVRSSILSKVGDIEFQVVITEPDGTVTKYDKFTMTVKDAIDTDAEMPEEYPSWVEMANEKLAEVDEAISNVEDAIENANNVADELLEAKENGEFNGKDGVDGKDGTNGLNGKDGVSPTFETEQIEGGAKITITDVDGTHEVLLKDGQQGVQGVQGVKGDKGDKGDTGLQGVAGKDGTSPTATVEETTTGAKITITDVNGTTTANIYNGKDGADGEGGGIANETDPLYTADKPKLALKSEIPTNLSELNNDEGFIKSYTETDPLYTADKDKLALKTEIPDITGKQDTLVSGENIKTINGESILGSGNIVIEGGSGGGSSSVAKTTLWEGSLTQANDTATLSQNLENFDDILVKGYLLNANNLTRYVPVGQFDTEDIIDSYGTQNRFIFNMLGDVFASSSLAVYLNFVDSTTVKVHSINKTTNINNFAITSIEGIKYNSTGSSGGGSESGGSGYSEAVLLENNTGMTASTSYTLTDDITNYQMLFIEACCDGSSNDAIGIFKQTMTIPVSAITYLANTSSNNNTYAVVIENSGTTVYSRIVFGFTNSNTLYVNAIGSQTWKNVRVSKIVGIKY